MDYTYDVIITLQQHISNTDQNSMDQDDPFLLETNCLEDKSPALNLFKVLPSDTFLFLQPGDIPPGTELSISNSTLVYFAPKASSLAVSRPADEDLFPFELTKFFQRKKMRSNQSGIDVKLTELGHKVKLSNDSGVSGDIAEESKLSGSNVLPITHYQPHYRRHKRTLVYEKHMSSFSTIGASNWGLNETPPGTSDSSNSGSSTNENPMVSDPEDEKSTSKIDHWEDDSPDIPLELSQSSSSDKEQKDNNKTNKKDEYPDVKDMLFEFSDTNLESRLNSDLNPCHKRDRSMNRKVQWKKMTPELFQEIYQWEKTQSRVKQNQIQSRFQVNRSTYYRWKKKYLLAHPEDSELFSTPTNKSGD